MYFGVDSFNWWYTFLFPGTITLGASMITMKDKKMNNRAVLSIPVELNKVWLSKVLICLATQTAACLILLLGIIIGGSILFVGKVPIFNGIAGMIVIIITFAWQIPFCLYLSYRTGIFSTIILNMGANIIVGTLTATMGKLWINPYGIPSRLMCPILKVLPNGLPAVNGSITFKPELLSYDTLIPGLIVSIAFMILITVLTARWYERQETI